MGRRRNARSKKKNRKERALAVQTHLVEVLRDSPKGPPVLAERAAVHLVKSSKRHRLPLPKDAKELVCRKCWSHHVHADAFRVRIKAGQRIKTCLTCGTVRRYGGGPGFHRRAQRSG